MDNLIERQLIDLLRGCTETRARVALQIVMDAGEAKLRNPPRPALVFVTVEGGVATVDVDDIRGNVTVRLRDYDNGEGWDGDSASDDIVCDIDGNLCSEVFYGVDDPNAEKGAKPCPKL